MRRIIVSMFVVVLAAAFGGAAFGAPVQRTVTTVNGVKVDKYKWVDSHGRPRTVSLKREGEGNPGHGGYAVQMTYQVENGATFRTVVVNQVAGGDGGFGYFVSHERYRDFTDGSNDTIAHRVFGADDSPLGRNFPVVGTPLTLGNPNAAAHRFKLTYPRYGTIAPIPKDEDGNDVSATPVVKAKSKLYSLPVTIIWVFQNGLDYPRIKIAVGLGDLPGPDRANFDLRAPYGVMNFDNGGNNNISKVMWGDRYHFVNLTKPLTRNSSWQWTGANNGARYTALVAGDYEMGLLEPRTFSSSALVDGYSDGRGKTSASYRCDDQDQELPCDWEWPYQSAQYSLSYEDLDEPTTFEKIAWGTAPYWGTGSSMTRVWDTSETSRPFNGFPSSEQITYNICVVLGLTIPGGLTKSVAAGPSYNCATATAP